MPAAHAGTEVEERRAPFPHARLSGPMRASTRVTVQSDIMMPDAADYRS
jgi:hypothetical protein